MNAESIRVRDCLKCPRELPPELISAAAELRKTAAGGTIAVLTVSGLCAQLNLELDAREFNAAPAPWYADLNRLLTALGLRPVPSYIPADIQWESAVFVCKNPAIEQDVDCVRVRELIAGKRAPRTEDLKHIELMNHKLANYNILLRVFEALGTVVGQTLQAEQGQYLNRVLSERVLPHEGERYLRACFSYANENRNYLCAYANPRCCLKPMDRRGREQIARILANLIVRGISVREIDRAFPCAEELEEALEDLKRGHETGVGVFPYFEARDPGPGDLPCLITGSRARVAFDRRVRLSAAPAPRRGPPGPRESAERAGLIERLCANLKGLPAWMLTMLRAALSAAPSVFSGALPDCSRVFMTEAGDFFDCGRACDFFYTTDRPELALRFPFLCSGRLTAGGAESSPDFNELQDFFENPRPEDGAQRLRLLHTLFFGLIIQNTLEGHDRARSGRLLRILDGELDGAPFALLFIRALYFALFAYSPSGQAPADRLSRLGLALFPEVNRIVLYRLFDRYGRHPALWPAGQDIFVRLEFISGRMRGLAKRSLELGNSHRLDKVLAYLLLLLDLRRLDPASALVFFGVEKLTGRNSPRPLSRSDQDLMSVLRLPVVRGIFGPLLDPQGYPEFVPWFFAFDSGSLEMFSSAVTEKKAHLDFLFETALSSDQPLTDLILHTLSREYFNIFKKKVLGGRFHDLSQLCGQFTRRFNPVYARSFELALLEYGLVMVPLESRRTELIVKPSRTHIVVPLNDLNEPVDSAVLISLSQAQFIYTLMYARAGLRDFEDRLIETLGTDPGLKDCLRRFVKGLSLLRHALKPFTDAELRHLRRYCETCDLYRETLERFFSLAGTYTAELRCTDRGFLELRHLKEVLGPGQPDGERPPDGGRAARTPSNTLDHGLIVSKLKESAEIREVISRLRDANEAAAVQVQTAHAAPPDNVCRLLAMIAEQKAEVLDLEEFKGLCLSLKFMSPDAAVEELNDWSYSECDEPLFELAPEENSVYISVSVLNRLTGLRSPSQSV